LLDTLLIFTESKGIRILGEIMKQRIDIEWSKEKLDPFLKEKYGYEVWDFEFFFINLFHFYDVAKEPLREHQFMEKRINRLKNIKRRIIELLDDFLIEINFYENDKLISKKNNIWTPQSKENCIIKNFEIGTLLSVIDTLIQTFKELDSRLYDESVSIRCKETLRKLRKVLSKENFIIKDPEIGTLLSEIDRLFQINIKPQALLILTLSYVMQAGKKVDWINMKILLNWFSIKFDEIGILDFFGMEKCKVPSVNILRFTRNKYKNTKYNYYARRLFAITFENAKEYWQDEIPKPLNKLYEHLKISKNFEERKKFLDFWLGVNLTIKLKN